MREVVAWALSFLITLMFMVVGGNIYLKIRNALSKRPHKSDDEEDNPIVKFKDDLAEIYESNPNGKLKKLAQAVWNRVEEIEKWHNAEIHDWERKYYSAKWDVGELSVKCDGYREELDEWTQRCEELQSKLNESQERLKRESAKTKTLESETDKLRDMLKEEREKNKIPLFTKPVEAPDYLIEKRFPGQTDPFIKITMDEEALKQSIPMNTGAIIHIDSEDLNRYSVGRGPDGNLLKDEPPIYSEEFNKKLRDWWGLDADTNKWPDFMMQVNCVPKEWNRYRVTVRNKCGATSTVHEWAPNPGYFINKFKESNYTVLSYDLDNPVYRGEESTT
jgi:hypothetical protein